MSEFSFNSQSEYELQREFFDNAYIKQKVENREALNSIRNEVVRVTARILGRKFPPIEAHGDFLDNIHQFIRPEELNSIRLDIISHLMNLPWFRAAYYQCGQSCLQSIIGSELAMQRNLGLSIQMPNDTLSLLPLHSDVWGSECSGFEAVMWIPLVDCYDTKSIFWLPPDKDREWRSKVSNFSESGSKSLFESIKPELKWLNVKFGEMLLFSPTVMHGNRENIEDTTRWSINIRFKGVFTPYSGKQLGDYFTPITLKPLSRIGMSFEVPGGF